jgi:hypothetical protein
LTGTQAFNLLAHQAHINMRIGMRHKASGYNRRLSIKSSSPLCSVKATGFDNFPEIVFL